MRRARVEGDTPRERIASICRIAADRPRGAGEALARAAVEEPDPEVRRAAAAALGQFVCPECRPAVERAASDDSPRVRQAGAETLSLYRDGRAAEVLVKLARGDGDNGVRRAALRGLRRCDDPRAFVVLLDVAERGDTIEMQRQAAAALAGKLGARLDGRHDPSNPPVWRDLLQRFRRIEAVRKAHAELSAPLADRPQDLLGTDSHPERRRTGEAGESRP
jgi:HEAT repeat protein